MGIESASHLPGARRRRTYGNAASVEEETSISRSRHAPIAAYTDVLTVKRLKYKFGDIQPLDFSRLTVSTRQRIDRRNSSLRSASIFRHCDSTDRTLWTAVDLPAYASPDYVPTTCILAFLETETSTISTIKRAGWRVVFRRTSRAAGIALPAF
ncbi:hypothetical protein NA56DRAFT_127673 [Hyaloscypha hepaticicola]|uniref:Uncharacterized protein n=1 Tax=Hyaloscypha hepaticicola TaxID=2082293 RepID=A0A2J6Q5B8_9HELO|nr:hypothetical protein NA56DRAFT_127673 [Hyaloscypha hepaticicola]